MRTCRLSLLASLACLFLFVTVHAPALTVAQIQSEINTILNRSALSGVTWTILIQNQEGTMTYYSRNPDTGRRPASNTKLFTTAAAFGRLGPTYSWNGGQIQNTTKPINKNSDNALADELLRDLGWLRGSGYSLAAGATVAVNWCSSIGINMSGARMDDGSGLDYDNRFTARQLVGLIRHMLANYSTFDDTLSIGCVDGTLGSRFCGNADTSGRVHGKTGSLPNGQAISLSGYIRNRHDGKNYIFSFIANNIPSANQNAGRAALDDIVEIMGRAGIEQPATSTPIVVDNSSTGFAASTNWWSGASTPGFIGTDYMVRSTETISDAATWSANLPSAGTYKVEVRYTSGSNRASAASYIVYHTGGSTSKPVNQQAGGGTWVNLGNFSMASGNATRVALSCWTTSGTYVVADAVRLTKI